MKVLVDTCTFLWMADDAPELSRQARTVVTDPAVRYRPERVKGARYEVKGDVPRSEKKRG